MSLNHLSDDLCMDYLNGELPLSEMPSFEDHLQQCSQCQQRLDEFETILTNGQLNMADDLGDGPLPSFVPWSIEEGEKRLYAAIESDTQVANRFGEANRTIEKVQGGIRTA